MMFHTSLVWAMVLLTSGIVDERPQLGVMTVSTARVLPPVLGGWGGGVEPRWWSGVGGFGTLLGFEGSHASATYGCMLLTCLSGVWSVFSPCGLLRWLLLVWWGLGLVGWLVDSWIVDASILLAPHDPWPVGGLGVGCDWFHQIGRGVWCWSL